MEYHTLSYLFVFLPAVLLVYQLVPKKGRPAVLLLAGYVFFWTISGKLLIFLIGTTLWAYAVGLWLTRLKTGPGNKKAERRVLALGILLLLAVLGYLKYYNFFAFNWNKIADGTALALPLKKLLLPVGISFYTLEAIGYMTDVYWGKTSSDRTPFKLALFLSFFPKMMEGPISSYAVTADSLTRGEPLKMEDLRDGWIRVFWGLFKKLIIADRLAVLVRTVFEDFAQYHGAVVALAAVSYTLQLYMEFSGSIDIVLGSAKMFGISLPENFRQPFFSKNAGEFWRRWHITLGTWLKTYIFYPVSLSGIVRKWNRFGKKHLPKYWTRLGAVVLTLFPVWLINGVWHGPKWNYIFFGMYYFVVLVLESALEPARTAVLKKCRIPENALWYRVLRVLKTWVIIFTGELIFRADGVRAAFYMLRSMTEGFSLRIFTDGTLLTLGLDRADLLAAVCGIAVVAAVDFIREKDLLRGKPVEKWPVAARWTVYYALILAVVIFGAYGIGYQAVDLIYAGF